MKTQHANSKTIYCFNLFGSWILVLEFRNDTSLS